jgi:pimeloyl-ACP methyl ester carboxylesterase
MTGHHAVRRRTVRANDIEFVVLEAGTGPLALCLHGFPDAAPTWRHLLPELAAAGFHAVAPFMRGYAPTAVPRDGNYSIGALVADAVALHQVMGGDEQAVLIGSDWGAETAYAAAAFAPGRWRRLVTHAVPPMGWRLSTSYGGTGHPATPPGISRRSRTACATPPTSARPSATTERRPTRRGLAGPAGMQPGSGLRCGPPGSPPSTEAAR